MSDPRPILDYLTEIAALRNLKEAETWYWKNQSELEALQSGGRDDDFAQVIGSYHMKRRELK